MDLGLRASLSACWLACRSIKLLGKRFAGTFYPEILKTAKIRRRSGKFHF